MNTGETLQPTIFDLPFKDVVSGLFEWRFPVGSIITIEGYSDKLVILPDQQFEMINADGTVKTWRRTGEQL